MSFEKDIEVIRNSFIEGAISLDDLLLYVEPVLNQCVMDPIKQLAAKKIINEIETAIFSKNEPQRTDLIGELLNAARDLARDSSQ
jgi:hypothetical protein